jgi:hypothetical protein
MTADFPDRRRRAFIAGIPGQGTWIPIISQAEARAHADDFLVLPWHFLPEIQITLQVT